MVRELGAGREARVQVALDGADVTRANVAVAYVEGALLDWSAAAGWRVSFRSVRYDPEPLHRALLALRGDYPVAAYVANRQRPASAAAVPDEPLDFVRYRWGDAPAWWEQRDELPAWRALRGNGDELIVGAAESVRRAHAHGLRHTAR